MLLHLQFCGELLQCCPSPPATGAHTPIPSPCPIRLRQLGLLITVFTTVRDASAGQSSGTAAQKRVSTRVTVTVTVVRQRAAQQRRLRAEAGGGSARDATGWTGAGGMCDEQHPESVGAVVPRWCCDWGGWRRCRTVGCTGQRLLGTLHLGTGTGPLWGRGRTVLLGQEAEGGSSSGHAVGGRGWVWVRPAHRKLQTPVVATLLRGPHGLTMINTGIGACLFGENSNNDDRRACIKTLAANYPVCSHHVRCGTAVHDCSQTGVR